MVVVQQEPVDLVATKRKVRDGQYIRHYPRCIQITILNITTLRTCGVITRILTYRSPLDDSPTRYLGDCASR